MTPQQLSLWPEPENLLLFPDWEAGPVAAHIEIEQPTPTPKLSKHATLIYQIFEHFRRTGRRIFTGLGWLAGQINACTRTVQRALAELRAIGVLQSERRFRRSSMHELKATLKFKPQRPAAAKIVAINQPPRKRLVVTCRDSSKPCTNSKSVKHTHTARVNVTPQRKGVQSTHSRMSPNESLPVGYEEQIQRYIGIAIASGRPFERKSITRIATAFRSVPIDRWESVIAEFEKRCRSTQDVRYMPNPLNFLLDGKWDLISAPRTLPYDPPAKPDRAQEAYDDILDALQKAKKTA